MSDDDKARQVTSITGEIITADGAKRQFSLSADYSWQQWGEVPDKLSNTVQVVDALQSAAGEFLVSDYDNDEESNDDRNED